MIFAIMNRGGPLEMLRTMRWWPFGKWNRARVDDPPHVKGTRMWLQELRSICEKNYQNPSAGQALVREMQVEWTDANRRGDLDDMLLQGLDRRAFRLLRASGEEWIGWLDNERFWEPGWKGGFETE